MTSYSNIKRDKIFSLELTEKKIEKKKSLQYGKILPQNNVIREL